MQRVEIAPLPSNLSDRVRPCFKKKEGGQEGGRKKGERKNLIGTLGCWHRSHCRLLVSIWVARPWVRANSWPSQLCLKREEV